MSLDDLKPNWEFQAPEGFNRMDARSFNEAVKTRARKQSGAAFQYFWASFVMQIVVYALSAHVIVKHFGNGLIMIPALAAILLYVPFTVVLMKKFKSIATLKDASVNAYIEKQYGLLESFYVFKKRYELVLVPLATLIGTFIVFEIWVPGSVWAFPKAAMTTFFITLASCIIAIREENKKSFDIPLSKLRLILEDLKAN